MAEATNILTGQIDLFGEQSESWQRDHAEAMACMDFEEVIAFGNFIFERIRHIDAEWSAEMEREGAEPPLADAKSVQALYAGWLAGARRNMGRAAEFARAGHAVRGIEPFRQAVREAEAVVSVPVERVREAAASLREGHARPLAEVRDELLRRLGPAGREGS